MCSAVRRRMFVKGMTSSVPTVGTDGRALGAAVGVAAAAGVGGAVASSTGEAAAVAESGVAGEEARPRPPSGTSPPALHRHDARRWRSIRGPRDAAAHPGSRHVLRLKGVLVEQPAHDRREDPIPPASPAVVASGVGRLGLGLRPRGFDSDGRGRLRCWWRRDDRCRWGRRCDDGGWRGHRRCRGGCRRLLGRRRGCERGGRRGCHPATDIGADDGENRADVDRVPFGDADLRHNPGGRRRHLRIDFVRRDLEQRLVTLGNVSPTCFSQRVTVPSVTVSPSCGMITSANVQSPSGES